MLVFTMQSCITNETIFELNPQQSMSITGKGQGQDAAINPFGNEKCISEVSNLGKTTFSVRIQENGKVIKEEIVQPKQSNEFILEIGYELYLDSDEKGKAKVVFKKIN